MAVNSINFWILSCCYYDRGKSCHQDVGMSSTLRAPAPRKLGPNALKALPFTQKKVSDYWEYYKYNAPDKNPEEWWKYQTLLKAALCNSVIAICFTPANEYLTKPQLLYAMKGEDTSQIHGFTIPNVEDPRIVPVDPTRFSIVISAQDLDGNDATYLNLLQRLQPQVDSLDKINLKDKKAISYILLRFTQDPLNQAITLTLKKEDDTIKTYIWTKSSPTSH